MVMPDVNVLVAAYQPDHPQHGPIRQWLLEIVNGSNNFAINELILASFVRVITHPKASKAPASPTDAFEFCNSILRSTKCIVVRPGSAHCKIFERFCRNTPAIGKLVPDAWFAALAIENDCEWVTADRDFARFAGLTWRHPTDRRAITNPT